MWYEVKNIQLNEEKGFRLGVSEGYVLELVKINNEETYLTKEEAWKLGDALMTWSEQIPY